MTDSPGQEASDRLAVWPRPRLDPPVDDWLTQPRQNTTKRGESPRVPKARNRRICRWKANEPGHTHLLAMQKVEASSPVSRFDEGPATTSLPCLPAPSTHRAGRDKLLPQAAGSPRVGRCTVASLSDPERIVQKELGIQEYTDPDDDAMVPHTLALKPGVVIHSEYNGHGFLSRPSVVDLWHTMRAVSREIRPDWTSPHRASARPGTRATCRTSTAGTSGLPEPPRMTLLGIVTARAAAGAEVRDHAGPDAPRRRCGRVARAFPPPARAEHTQAQPKA